MYCPKCGKKLPDGAKFCDECGANLQGGATSDAQNNNAAFHVIWIICLVASLILLFWAFNTYYNSPNRWWYGHVTEQDTPVIAMGIIAFIGVIVGIVGLCYPRFKNSNQPNLAERRTPQATPRTAQKLTMQGHGSVIKCSHCGKLQTANRTTCQSCGAKFIE